MHEGNTAIAIRFKQSPLELKEGQHHNWLIINIQPRECIKIEMESKIPGLDIATRTMSLDGAQRQQGDETIDSYETLMLNLMEGDPSQYLHISEVEAQWRLVDQIVNAWAKDKTPLHQYRAGDRDPEASSIIFEAEDQFWRYSIELGGDEH
jgi:glucose-6-phosphate 1-dehydrogenase